MPYHAVGKVIWMLKRLRYDGKYLCIQLYHHNEVTTTTEGTVHTPLARQTKTQFIIPS